MRTVKIHLVWMNNNMFFIIKFLFPLSA